MAALRERYSPRDGVGHANRPWFHDAIGLDAQSRRLCLSFAGRRRYSHSNTYRDTNGNSHCDGNSDTDAETYTLTQGYTVAEATSYASATAIRRLTSK